MIYSSPDIECVRLKLVIMGHFLPFYPTINLKNQNFEKMKKSIWRYHHLDLYTKNHDQMMYASRDKECNNFLSPWATFCTLNQH